MLFTSVPYRFLVSLVFDLECLSTNLDICVDQSYLPIMAPYIMGPGMKARRLTSTRLNP